MLGQATITVIGNITSDVELRFTPSGAAVVTLSVADNPRKKNQQTGEYENGESTFYRVQAWRQQAENIAESFNKGDRVVVVGELQNRKYETDNGTRYSQEINAQAVAADTRWATVQVRKADRQQGGQQQNQGYQQSAQQGYQQQPQQGYGSNAPADPWSTPPPQQSQQRPNQAPPQSDPWGSHPTPAGQQPGMFPDEPPF